MTIDVMEGMTLEEASQKHGIGTRQAAQKIFRLTSVNLFLFDDRKEIEKNNYDINVIRKLWRESKTGYFS